MAEAAKVAKNLLLVIPFGTADFDAGLPKVNAPPAKLIDLILRNVVIQKNHAAELRRTSISLTTPRCIKRMASRTA